MYIVFYRTSAIYDYELYHLFKCRREKYHDERVFFNISKTDRHIKKRNLE